ncbi:hypothetical protein CHUAL_013667, partial [Chamberlinius hualienensis]
MICSLDSCMNTLEGSLLGYKDVAKEVSTLKSEMKGVKIDSGSILPSLIGILLDILQNQSLGII